VTVRVRKGRLVVEPAVARPVVSRKISARPRLTDPTRPSSLRNLHSRFSVGSNAPLESLL
jgi:hypothetical protein